ncbi:hypothetical protein [Pseudomonas sp. NUPR-001]|uniref:hypothetical protein n=1 Tax=Pseudomonas sp. NUPR-001 TaxID=3416058 RepID=UPI003F99F880
MRNHNDTPDEAESALHKSMREATNSKIDGAEHFQLRRNLDAVVPIPKDLPSGPPSTTPLTPKGIWTVNNYTIESPKDFYKNPQKYFSTNNIPSDNDNQDS